MVLKFAVGGQELGLWSDVLMDSSFWSKEYLLLWGYQTCSPMTASWIQSVSCAEATVAVVTDTPWRSSAALKPAFSPSSSQRCGAPSTSDHSMLAMSSSPFGWSFDWLSSVELELDGQSEVVDAAAPDASRRRCAQGDTSRSSVRYRPVALRLASIRPETADSAMVAAAALRTSSCWRTWIDD